jgi:hypothetical protein
MTARLLLIPITIVLLALLAACGGGAKVETEATATPTIEATPTMPYTPYTPAIGSPVRRPLTIGFWVRVRVDVAPEPSMTVGPLYSEITTETECQRDEGGRVIAIVTTISTPAVYKDGSPLMYTWSASNGRITGSGPEATWTQSIASGEAGTGEATLLVSDGIGGILSM